MYTTHLGFPSSRKDPLQAIGADFFVFGFCQKTGPGEECVAFGENLPCPHWIDNLSWKGRSPLGLIKLILFLFDLCQVTLKKNRYAEWKQTVPTSRLHMEEKLNRTASFDPIETNTSQSFSPTPRRAPWWVEYMQFKAPDWMRGR